MQQQKEFSILKWIIFPLISVVLAGSIAYFNLRVFGFEDGIPYAVIVSMIGLFSIIINRYTDSLNWKLAVATFVFEILLTVMLIGNAAYSLSVQRKMAVARMADHERTESLESIGKLKGGRTQRAALNKLGEAHSAQDAFAEYEDTLFWIMVAELMLFGVAAFTLFGVAKLVEPTFRRVNGQTITGQYPEQRDGREFVRDQQGRPAEVRSDLTEEEARREADRTGRTIAIPERYSYFDNRGRQISEDEYNRLPVPAMRDRENSRHFEEPQQKPTLKWRGGQAREVSGEVNGHSGK